MRRVGVGLGALVWALATSAQAADLPGPGPGPLYSPQPIVYNWSGFYVGGSLGGAWLFDTTTTQSATILQSAGSQTSLTQSGFLGGAQAGVNYELAPWVIGAEGTWYGSYLTGSINSPTLLTSTLIRRTSNVHWYATATARAGYAVNNLLAYVKGGIAWMSVGYTADLLFNGGVTDTANVADTRTGWTVGAGVEYGFSETLSARAEYDFLDFGTHTYTFNFPVTAVAAPASVKSQSHLFMVGLNYRFIWGGGPAVARY